MNYTDAIHNCIKNGELEIKDIFELEDYGIPRDYILKYFEKYNNTMSEEDIATFKMIDALR